MLVVDSILRLFSRHGRILLAASLVLGIAVEPVTRIVLPYIEILIVLLLVLTALRIDPGQIAGLRQSFRSDVFVIIGLQVVLPLSLLFVLRLTELDSPKFLVLVLLTAAPPLAGAPHLVKLLGYDPKPVIKFLVTGTLLLPLTVIPVLTQIPEFADLKEVLRASVRLCLIIAAATGVAILIRKYLVKTLNQEALMRIDGSSTLLLFMIALGLLSSIHPTLDRNPSDLIVTLLLVLTVNFGLQVLTTIVLSRSRASHLAVPIAVISGNRNIALFLPALALASNPSVLLFIACYQIPMYLTPVIMQFFYANFSDSKNP